MEDDPTPYAQQFGPYTLVRELGRGGQATVWLAEEERLGRKVALKLLHAGPGSISDHEIARFRREAEAASRLEHANICALLDAGEVDGVPFLAFRYIDGETLTTLIAGWAGEGVAESADGADPGPIAAGPGSKQSIHHIVHTFEKIARALHTAHEKGLIHRDIKPGNIILARADGEPVILDFGLARDEMDNASLTRSGDLVGTPAYMSPEQLMAQRIPLDRRTDIYSLGSTLYEALTLRRPFEALTRAELYKRILTSEPTGATTLNRLVERDLRVVVETAMEKDRDRRYQTALDLAEDLRRVRRFEPIRARPIGPTLRLRRWVQRHPAAATGLLGLVTALVLALAFLFDRSRSLQRVRALALANAASRAVKVDNMLGLLMARDAAIMHESVETTSQLHLMLATANEWRRIEHGAEVNDGRHLADGRFVTATADGVIRLMNSTGDEIRRFAHERGAAFHAVAPSPDGSTLLAACADRRIWIFDLTGRSPPRTIPPDVPLHESPVLNVAWSPDGRRFASASRDTAYVWTPGREQPVRYEETAGAIEFVAFDRDGAQVVVGSEAGFVRVFDANTGLVRRTFDLGPRTNFGALRPGTDQFVTAGGNVIGSFDLNDLGSVRKTTVRFGSLESLAVLEHGGCVTGSWDQSVREISPDGVLVRTMRGHSDVATAVSVSRDGRMILSTSLDGTARMWEAQVPEVPILLEDPDYVRGVAFAPDGNSIASSASGVRLWSRDGSSSIGCETPESLPVWKSLRVCFAASGRWIAARFRTGRLPGTSGAFAVWSRTGEFRCGTRLSPNYVASITFHPSNDDLLAVAVGPTCQVWDLNDLRSAREIYDAGESVMSVAFSPDGERMITGTTGHIVVWRSGRNSPVARWPQPHPVSSAQFTSDGGQLLIRSGREARLIDVANGAVDRVFGPHAGEVLAAALSPRGDRVLTTSRDGTARLWTIEGELVAALAPDRGLIYSAAFSPDGRYFVTGHVGLTRVWITDRAELLRVANRRIDHLGRRYSEAELKNYAELLDR